MEMRNTMRIVEILRLGCDGRSFISRLFVVGSIVGEDDFSNIVLGIDNSSGGLPILLLLRLLLLLADVASAGSIVIVPEENLTRVLRSRGLRFKRSVHEGELNIRNNYENWYDSILI